MFGWDVLPSADIYMHIQDTENCLGLVKKVAITKILKEKCSSCDTKIQ